jgi:hypothetical protein
MYLIEPTYDVVVAYVQGFDEAYEGGLLEGFKEWLLMRLDGGDNLSWVGLVPYIAFREAHSARAEALKSAEAQRHAIDTLFGLLAEFDDLRAKYSGLRTILRDYEKWHERKRAED